jgi:histidine triad (HIT) family protein
MAETQSCIFCAIASGTVPAEMVGSTERTVAFRDLNPQAPMHVLVIPRRHIENAATVSDADGDLLTEMVVAAREVAESQGVAQSGYRLVFNVGEDAQNSVPHLHLHVLGGRVMSWPPG